MSSRLLPWKKDDRRHSLPAADDTDAVDPPRPAADPQSQQPQPSSSSRRRPVSFLSSSQSSSQSQAPQAEERQDSVPGPRGGTEPEDSEAMCKRPPTAGSGPGRTKFLSRKAFTGTRSAPPSSHGQFESSSAVMPTPSSSQTQTQGPVELPGSLLLTNEGFPSTDPAAGRLARWSRGPEKLLPSLAASLGLEKPKAATETVSIASRDSASLRSFSDSASPDQTARSSSTTPQSPNPDRTSQQGTPRVPTRPGFGSPKVISEAQRVSQVLARRVRDLESTLRERDETVKSFKAELEGSRRAHENELAKIREFHSTEIRSLKATFTLLDRVQLDSIPAPLQISTLHDSNKMANLNMGNGQDMHKSRGTELEAAKQSTENTSEGIPSSTVSEPMGRRSEETIREDIRLEFEKRLEGERRRRKEVLERAQDLHQSREAELIEKLDAGDKRVRELEEEIAVWKDDVERVEETLQKFIRISEEDQAEAVKNAAAKREAEAECAALRGAIAEKDEELCNLRAELEEAKRNIGHSSSPAGDSTSSDQQQPAQQPSAEAAAGNRDGTEYVQKLEEEIKAHLEDIRLYKLDVRGYRKDVRSRDAKISYLTQHIVDLEKNVQAKTTEAEDLRSRLAIAKKLEMEAQQRQQAASQQRLGISAGLGLNFDEVSDVRRQTSPDWPLPQPPQRNHNSSTPIRQVRKSSSGRSGSMNPPDHPNPEIESGMAVTHSREPQSQVLPLSPHHTPRAQQQGHETLFDDGTPTPPRSRPPAILEVNRTETVSVHLRQQKGLEQATQGVGVAVVSGIPGQSWILD